MRCSDDLNTAFRQALIGKKPGAYRIVDIVIDICYSVGKTHDITFESTWIAVLFMVQYSVTNFISQIETNAVFQFFNYSQALLVMLKTAGDERIKHGFTGMPEGSMPKIMPHGDGFSEVFVKKQTS